MIRLRSASNFQAVGVWKGRPASQERRLQPVSPTAPCLAPNVYEQKRARPRMARDDQRRLCPHKTLVRGFHQGTSTWTASPTSLPNAFPGRSSDPGDRKARAIYSEGLVHCPSAWTDLGMEPAVIKPTAQSHRPHLRFLRVGGLIHSTCSRNRSYIHSKPRGRASERFWFSSHSSYRRVTLGTSFWIRLGAPPPERLLVAIPTSCVRASVNGWLAELAIQLRICTQVGTTLFVKFQISWCGAWAEGKITTLRGFECVMVVW